MIRVNLLQISPARRTFGATLAGDRELRAVAIVATVLAVLTGGVWFQLRQQAVDLYARLYVLEAYAASLDADVARTMALDRQQKELAAEVERASERERQARAVVDLFSAVSDSLPDGLWLLDLNLHHTPPVVDIEGRAKTVSGVSKFAENLEGAGIFAGPVDIQSTTAELVERLPSFRFRIKATVR